MRVGAEGWFQISFPNDRAGRTNRWTLRLVPASGYNAVQRTGRRSCAARASDRARAGRRCAPSSGGCTRLHYALSG